MDIVRGPEFWDRYFLGMAQYVASASKDPSTQTGAVLVDADKGVISLGYNGFPRGIADLPERYADRELKYSMVVHCEMNAVLSAKRSVIGSTLYVWPFLSCDRCCVHMIQAGVKRVVAPIASADKLERWADSFAKSRAIFAEGGVDVLELDCE